MGVVVNTVKVALSGSLPPGSNVIGGVTQSGTWNVGISGTPTVTLGTGSALIGRVRIDPVELPAFEVIPFQNASQYVKQVNSNGNGVDTVSYHLVSADASYLHGYYIYNVSSNWRFVYIYEAYHGEVIPPGDSFDNTGPIVIGIPPEGAANMMFVDHPPFFISGFVVAFSSGTLGGSGKGDPLVGDEVMCNFLWTPVPASDPLGPPGDDR